MTREEALLKIGELVAYARTQGWDDVYTDAFKTLEQEPCEDAVSRQQAISAIRNLYPGRPFVKLNLKKWQEENKKYFECENIIKTFPSVTPIRKKGKWIVKDGREQGYDIAGYKTWYIQIMCNKCGFINTSIEGHTGQYNYCPNCGADMREV